MISRKCRGITFIMLPNWWPLRGCRGCVLLRRNQSAFFLEVKKQTFLNWLKTLTLGGGRERNKLV